MPDWLRRFLHQPADPAQQLSNELVREIRQSFDEASLNEEHFPSTIDPRIQHVQVLKRFFAPLDNHRLLDLGCGKGRFARVLLEENPHARITGLDISEQMLHSTPEGIGKISAIMTAIPFTDASFDGL